MKPLIEGKNLSQQFFVPRPFFEVLRQVQLRSSQAKQ